MDRLRMYFMAMDWLWFLLGVACLAGAALLVMRRSRLRELESLLERLESVPRRRRLSWVLLGAAPTVLLVLLKLAQYHFLILSFVSAETAQIVWQIAHGHGFMDSLALGRSFFSYHAMFTLAFLAPLVWIWESTAVLAAAHGAALGAAILGVFCLAKRLGGSALLGWMSALLMLSHPLFSGMAACNLEIRNYAPALFLGAVYCWETGRRKTALFLGLMLLGTIEQVPFLFFGLSLYAFVRAKDRKGRWTALALMGGSAAIFFAEEALIHRAKEGLDINNEWYLFEPLGAAGSSAGLMKSAILRPWIYLAALVYPPVKLLTPARALLSLGLLPLFSGACIIPALAVWLPQQLAIPTAAFHQLRDHYAGVVFGPLLWSAALGLARLYRGMKADSRALLASWVLVVAGFGFITADGFLSVAEDVRPRAWVGALAHAKAHIPDDAKLWCDEFFLPHFAMRRYIKQVANIPDPKFKIGVFAPDVVLFSNAWFALTELGYRDRVLVFLRRRGFVRVFQEGGIMVLADPRTLRGESVPLEWIDL